MSHKGNLSVCACVLGTALCFLTQGTLAGDVFWWDAGQGYWHDRFSWDPNTRIPTEGDTAIVNQGTVQFDRTDPGVCDRLLLATEGESVGAVTMDCTGGSLYVGSLDVGTGGYGVFSQSTGKVESSGVVLGRDSGATGMYTLPPWTATG